jgi:hypothetical protein
VAPQAGERGRGDDGVRPSPLNPAPEEMPTGPSRTDAAEIDKLLGEIAALRARVSAVSESMFLSRIALAIDTQGSRTKITRLDLLLDDGVVFTAPGNYRTDGLTTVFERAVAPGTHAVTVDVERQDPKGDAYRTTQRSRFTVDVPKDHRLEVRLRLDDESSLGADFAGDKSGKVELRVRMKVDAKRVGK